VVPGITKNNIPGADQGSNRSGVRRVSGWKQDCFLAPFKAGQGLFQLRMQVTVTHDQRTRSTTPASCLESLVYAVEQCFCGQAEVIIGSKITQGSTIDRDASCHLGSRSLLTVTTQMLVVETLEFVIYPT
jgi:hypothetical protein